MEDEEDAPLSAFDSFRKGVAGGRFPNLHDRDDPRRVLTTITRRESHDQIEREFAAMVAEEYRLRLESLGDPELAAIAERLGCSDRTVATGSSSSA